MAGLWLRLYTEIRYDRKLRRRPPGQRWLWVVILAIAKESPRPGWLLLSEAVPVTLDDLADEAAIPCEEVEAGINAFIEQTMLELVDGIYHVINWDKRQFVSDNSTERSQKCRQRKKGTLPQRCNGVAATPPETDSRQQTADPETDTEKDLSLTTGQSPEAAKPTGKELISELTDAYRAVEGVEQSKGDYAFIGALYNEHGYEKVLSAINKLQMAAAVQELKKPLVYLKGILEPRDKDGGKHGREPTQQDSKKKAFIRSLYV